MPLSLTSMALCARLHSRLQILYKASAEMVKEIELLGQAVASTVVSAHGIEDTPSAWLRMAQSVLGGCINAPDTYAF